MTSVSTYIGRQRGEGFLLERTSLRPLSYLVVSVPSAGISNIHDTTNILLLVQNKEHVCQMHSFNWGPSPPLGKAWKECYIRSYSKQPTTIWTPLTTGWGNDSQRISKFLHSLVSVYAYPIVGGVQVLITYSTFRLAAL